MKQDKWSIALKNYMLKDRSLLKNRLVPAINQLLGKKHRGVYDGDLAIGAMMYVVNTVGQRYANEYGEIAPRESKIRLATLLVDAFETVYPSKDYNDYVEKIRMTEGKDTLTPGQQEFIKLFVDNDTTGIGQLYNPGRAGKLEYINRVGSQLGLTLNDLNDLIARDIVRIVPQDDFDPMDKTYTITTAMPIDTIKALVNISGDSEADAGADDAEAPEDGGEDMGADGGEDKGPDKGAPKPPAGGPPKGPEDKGEDAPEEEKPAPDDKKPAK